MVFSGVERQLNEITHYKELGGERGKKPEVVFSVPDVQLIKAL